MEIKSPNNFIPVYERGPAISLEIQTGGEMHDMSAVSHVLLLGKSYPGAWHLLGASRCWVQLWMPAEDFSFHNEKRGMRVSLHRNLRRILRGSVPHARIFKELGISRILAPSYSVLWETYFLSGSLDNGLSNFLVLSRKLTKLLVFRDLHLMAGARSTDNECLIFN